MIYCIGDEADAIVKSFTFAERDEKKYAKVREKFDQHFIIKRNVIFERAKFNMRLKQEPREPVVAFITDLYCLFEHCEFGRFAQSDETFNYGMLIYVEEGQKLHEGPQLLRSHGAQEQVEVMAHKNKSRWII